MGELQFFHIDKVKIKKCIEVMPEHQERYETVQIDAKTKDGQKIIIMLHGDIMCKIKTRGKKKPQVNVCPF